MDPQQDEAQDVKSESEPGPKDNDTRGENVGRGLATNPRVEGQRRRPRQRQPRRRRTIPATTVSLNPINADFSQLSMRERLTQTGRWTKRYNMVRTRPQFRYDYDNWVIVNILVVVRFCQEEYHRLNCFYPREKFFLLEK